MPQTSLEIVILGCSFKDLPDTLSLLDYLQKIGIVLDHRLCGPEDAFANFSGGSCRRVFAMIRMFVTVPRIPLTRLTSTWPSFVMLMVVIVTTSRWFTSSTCALDVILQLVDSMFAVRHLGRLHCASFGLRNESSV